MLKRYVLCAVAGLALVACSARAGVEVQPAIVAAGDADDGKVWVCHRGRWQEVGAPAGDAHRRHGDRVADGRRSAGGSC